LKEKSLDSYDKLTGEICQTYVGVLTLEVGVVARSCISGGRLVARSQLLLLLRHSGPSICMTLYYQKCPDIITKQPRILMNGLYYKPDYSNLV
jgi:hypothetical protein